MNKKSFLIFCVAPLLLTLTSCRKDHEPNKIIEGLPIDVTQTIIPGQAAQEFLLINQSMINIAIPTMNRVGRPDLPFSEVTGPDGQGRYTFTTIDTRFGAPIFFMTFHNTDGSLVDLTNPLVSTNTVSFASVTGSGVSKLFSYSLNVDIVVATPGITTTDKTIRGNYHFDGAGYVLDFRFAGTGAPVTYLGMIGGQLYAAGTGGPQNAPAAISLNFDSSYDGNGSISWEGQQGTIHVGTEGKGYIATSTSRVFIY